MHPFTSLTLWALAAATTLLLPAETALPIYSAAAFLNLLLFRATRRRAKYVAAPLLAGHWPVAGPRRLVYPVAERPPSRPAALGQRHHAVAENSGDCFNVTAVDGVRTGTALYSRPVCFTPAAGRRLSVRWPAAGCRTAKAPADDYPRGPTRPRRTAGRERLSAAARYACAHYPSDPQRA